MDNQRAFLIKQGHHSRNKNAGMVETKGFTSNAASKKWENESGYWL